jgi:predicted nucleic acid-binding protein
VEKDRDDDKFFSCAIALQAGYIISGDKALIEIRQTLGVKELSPAEFLRISKDMQGISTQW